MAWNEGKPALGNSIAADITATRENFQHSHDSSGNIDGNIDGATLGANSNNTYSDLGPSGTVMLFGQASAPTGWTKKTDWQDGAMIVINSDVDGTALDSGGAVKPQVVHTHKWMDYTNTSTSQKTAKSDGTEQTFGSGTAGSSIKYIQCGGAGNEMIRGADETDCYVYNNSQFYYQECIFATKD